MARKPHRRPSPRPGKPAAQQGDAYRRSRAGRTAVAERPDVAERAQLRIEPPSGRTIIVPLGSNSAARQAFLERVTRYFAELASTAPESVIAGALSEPTALGTAAYALTEAAVEERPLDEADRQIAAALASGARYKEKLLTSAGGSYTAEQLGEVLGISRQAVNEGRKTNLYFAVPSGQTGFAYPKLQITKTGLLAGLRTFLDALTLPDPWMKLVVLMEPSERLNGRSPLEALRAGDVAQAVLVAATYGGHGA